MVKKALSLALAAIAGCVALVPQTQNPTTSPQGTAAQTPAPSSSQKASPTATPTATPLPTPTPVPTPLPKTILKLQFRPVPGAPDALEGDPIPFYGSLGGFPGGLNDWTNTLPVLGIALSTSGDMYLQAAISTNSIPVLCPTCDMNNVVGFKEDRNFRNYAIFKKTALEDEFEYVAMGGKEVLRWSYPGKTIYAYAMRDFIFSKLTEAASVSVAPSAVKGVNLATKEIHFDAAIWPKGPPVVSLASVATGDLFGLDDTHGGDGADYYIKGPDFVDPNLPEKPCANGTDAACENARALPATQERTAFTGSAAYFFGRGNIAGQEEAVGVWSQPIIRISESGSVERVGKSISDYFSKASDRPYSGSSPKTIWNVAYCRADGKLYILAWNVLYRVSEDALKTP